MKRPRILDRGKDEWGPFLAFGPSVFLVVSQIVFSGSVADTFFWIGLAVVVVAPLWIVVSEQEDAAIYCWLSIGAGLVAVFIGVVCLFLRICAGGVCTT